MNTARLKQIIFSVFIVAWGAFILNKVYDLGDIDYFFLTMKNLALALSALTQLKIIAGYLGDFINLFCLVSSSFVIGTIILSSWRVRSASFLEEFILGVGLGLSVWSYFTFSLGMLGALNVVLFKSLFWAVFAFSLWY
ncbi:MAG: hypothetical protein PHH44_07830 [bacterium]|jgi:hypothetical protein|nr:hypothetical protein [bacterium]